MSRNSLRRGSLLFAPACAFLLAAAPVSGAFAQSSGATPPAAGQGIEGANPNGDKAESPSGDLSTNRNAAPKGGTMMAKPPANATPMSTPAN